MTSNGFAPPTCLDRCQLWLNCITKWYLHLQIISAELQPSTYADYCLVLDIDIGHKLSHLMQEDGILGGCYFQGDKKWFCVAWYTKNSQILLGGYSVSKPRVIFYSLHNRC